MHHSRGSEALDRLLSEWPAVIAALASAGIHRTALWRYRTGRTTPGSDIAAKIQRLTDGAVPADSWAPTDPGHPVTGAA